MRSSLGEYRENVAEVAITVELVELQPASASEPPLFSVTLSSMTVRICRGLCRLVAPTLADPEAACNAGRTRVY